MEKESSKDILSHNTYEIRDIGCGYKYHILKFSQVQGVDLFEYKKLIEEHGVFDLETSFQVIE